MRSSLYRLPAFCHAGSLIPAVRFFPKEKSSLLRAGYSLRRTVVSAQIGIDLPIGLCRWGYSVPLRESFHYRRQAVALTEGFRASYSHHR